MVQRRIICGGSGGFALHEALRRRVAGVSESQVVQFPPFGGSPSVALVGVVPKVQTTSAKNVENGWLMCPGYCGECLRPDWRFGMSGQRKYSMELRERATRMALEARADPGRRRGAIKRIGGQLGINPEALRTWVRAVEQGGRNERGEVSDQEARIRALEAENRELRRANEILKAASAFFGAELDRLGR